MRRTTFMATALLLLLTTQGTLAAAPDAVAKAERRALEHRATAVRQVLDGAHAAREALEKEFRAAPDETAALAVQQRMEDLARTTEWEILGIQADYLRAAGRVDEAEAIEKSVRSMKQPPAKRKPVARPRPDAESDRSRS